MKRHQMKTVALIAGLAACCGVAQAVTTPYTADFGLGAGQVDIYTDSEYVISTPESTAEGPLLDPTWVTLADSLHLARTNSSYGSGFAAVATDLSAAAMTDFSMTSTVMMSTNGAVQYNRFGFLFLGDIATETGLTALFYPNLGDHGQIRIRNYAFGNAGVDVVDRTSGAVTNGSEFTLTLNGYFNDVGDLSLTLSVVNADGGGSEDMVVGTILAVNLPQGNEFGVTGRVGDFKGDYDQLTVLPSSAPMAIDDEYFLAFESSSTNVAAPGVLANDLGYDSAVLVSNISSGSLTFNADGSFSCSDLENGPNTFSYAVVSGSETSAPATVLLFASLAPDIPIVVDDTYELALYESQIVGNVLNNDTNTSAILEMFAMVEDDSTIANGALSFSSNGAFVYKPDVGFSGTETFTYQAFTEVATSDVATVTLIVEQSQYFTRFIDSFDTYDNSAGSNIRDMPDALVNWDPQGTASSATGFADIINGDGSDQQLQVGWGGSSYRGASSLTNLFSGIPAGTSEYWLYFEMYGTSLAVDGNFGLTVSQTPNSKAISDYAVGVRMFNGGGSNLNLYAYSSEGDVLLAEAIEEDTWYGVWLNINMSVGTYAAYVGEVGDASTLGALVGSDIPFSAAELPALMATSKGANNSLRINSVMNVDPDSFVNNLPAILEVGGNTAFDTIQLNIGLDVKANAADYWPISTDSLTVGTMVHVAHSDAPDGTFAVTNLTLASGDATNKVIYVKTTDGAEFFQIENNE